jgi:hypothetical protein
VDRVDELKDLININDLTSKRSGGQEQMTTSDTSSPPLSVSSYQENFYKTDSDCLKAGQQLNKFSFYETHLNGKISALFSFIQAATFNYFDRK